MKYQSACRECGVIVEYDKNDHDHNYHCPRCDHVIYAPGERFAYIIVMAIAAIISFVPTFFIPLLRLELGAHTQSATVLDVIYYFFQDGNYFISGIIFFTGIIAPLMMLFILLFILVPLHFHKRPAYINTFYHIYHDLKEWGMAEVYLISVLVSVIKLQNLGDLTIENGVFIFFFFLICFYLTTIWFNPDDIWHSDAKL